jgi:formylglycine-generating enzyme required for sulfatase activity
MTMGCHINSDIKKMEDDHMSKQPAFGFLLIAFIGCIPGSDTKAIPEVEMVSILLPGKTVKFSIGSNNEVDEKPAHEVIFTIPYAISKYEVSNKLFRLVINWALDKKYATLFDGDVWDPAKTFKYTGIKNLSEGTQDGLEIVNQKLEVKLVEDIRKSILIPADDFPVHGVTWYGSAYYAASPPQNPRGPQEGEPRLSRPVLRRDRLSPGTDNTIGLSYTLLPEAVPAYMIYYTSTTPRCAA